MKTFIAFSLLIVAIYCLPQDEIVDGINLSNERLVTRPIVEAIEDTSQSIRDAGLDPFYIKRKEFKYALPVPVLFNIHCFVEELLFTGLSNIVVHSISYNIITNRLTFDIRIPLIEFSLGKAVKDVTVLGSRVVSYASGRIAIVGIRLMGNIRFRHGIISGTSIRSMDMVLSLGDIQSHLKIVAHGTDYSKIVNRFFGCKLTKTLKQYSNEINELVEIIAIEAKL